MNNLKASPNALDLIMDYEGFSATPYKHDNDVWTIGYGHAILKNEHFDEITKEQGEQLLQKDILIAENCINGAVKVPLTQNQFDALVSFVFNLGCGSFAGSTLLKLLNQKLYDEAAQQFLRWDRLKGQEIEGLDERREAEQALFLGEDT
jgi:lysozyme